MKIQTQINPLWDKKKFNNKFLNFNIEGISELKFLKS